MALSRPRIPHSVLHDAPENVRRVVIFRIFHRNILSRESSGLELRKAIEKYQNMVPLCGIRNEEGLNLLQMAASSGDRHVLEVFFYTGVWKDMCHEIVIDNSIYGGLTARDITATRRGVSPRFAGVFDRYQYLSFNKPRLMADCLYGREERVREAIRRSPMDIAERDRNGSNCLFYACAGGNLSLLRLLLQSGTVDVSLTNNQGESCFHIACLLGRAEVVELLLELTGRSEMCLAADLQGKRPVDHVARNCDAEMLRVLCNHGVNLDGTLLCLAAKWNRLSMVKQLVEDYELPIDTEDPKKGTALHQAVYQSHTQLVRYLVEQGADLRHVDVHGRNVFHLVSESESTTSDKRHTLKCLIRECRQRNILKDLLGAHDMFSGRGCLFLVRGRDRGRPVWHYVEVERHLLIMFKKMLGRGLNEQWIFRQFGKILLSGWGNQPTRVACRKVNLVHCINVDQIIFQWIKLNTLYCKTEGSEDNRKNLTFEKHPSSIGLVCGIPTIGNYICPCNQSQITSVEPYSPDP